MRSLLLTTSLVLLPLAALAQDRCSAPDLGVSEEPLRLIAPVQPTAVPAVSNNVAPVPAGVYQTPVSAVASASPGAAATPPALTPSPPSAGTSTIPLLSRSQVDSVPGLARMAALGASVSDLGTSHGLRTVVARNAGEFMAFVVAPDGQAVIQGLMTDISVVQLGELAGSNLVELPTQHGLKAIFLHNGQQFQVFYATPDGERLIPGVMWDSTGKDVTHDQIAAIPGTIPTVIVGKDAEAAVAAAAKPGAAALPTVATGTAGAAPSPGPGMSVSGASLSALLQSTYPGHKGRKDAQEVWMFMDPECVFSVRAMNDLEALVDQDKIRLSVVTLSLIDPHNGGASTRNALKLLSLPEDQMVTAWSTRQYPDASSPLAGARLQANMRVSREIGLTGTPTLLWRKSDGTFGRVDGLPNAPASLAAMILADGT